MSLRHQNLGQRIVAAVLSVAVLASCQGPSQPGVQALNGSSREISGRTTTMVKHSTHLNFHVMEAGIEEFASPFSRVITGCYLSDCRNQYSLQSDFFGVHLDGAQWVLANSNLLGITTDWFDIPEGAINIKGRIDFSYVGPHLSISNGYGDIASYPLQGGQPGYQTFPIDGLSFTKGTQNRLSLVVEDNDTNGIPSERGVIATAYFTYDVAGADVSPSPDSTPSVVPSTIIIVPTPSPEASGSVSPSPSSVPSLMPSPLPSPILPSIAPSPAYSWPPRGGGSGAVIPAVVALAELLAARYGLQPVLANLAAPLAYTFVTAVRFSEAAQVLLSETAPISTATGPARAVIVTKVGAPGFRGAVSDLERLTVEMGKSLSDIKTQYAYKNQGPGIGKTLETVKSIDIGPGGGSGFATIIARSQSSAKDTVPTLEIQFKDPVMKAIFDAVHRTLGIGYQIDKSSSVKIRYPEF